MQLHLGFFLAIGLTTAHFKASAQQVGPTDSQKGHTPKAVEEGAAPKSGELITLEKEASFPGGDKALYNFIEQNLTYPEPAASSGLKGRVYVSFVVDREGSLQNIGVKRGLSPELDAEALRVVRLMPKWSPGILDGTPVAIEFNLPMVFPPKGAAH